MSFFRTQRKPLFGFGLGTGLVALALFFLAPSLALPFAIAGVLLALVWFGSGRLVTLFQRKKQRRFDAGVAAREGIDDRKREWISWTKELEQQGIDRYSLPFYLLVGEPQSGKSVLLQNSDLSFPFGQSRLSGIGGTRGCDWWFTEEAVILDLAGRLFTHEGGASDEAEWAAFLDLLAGYRPLCPANGLMLVLPCSSLLQDDREEATRKANKIQDALLTLTSKLQAQLPIYVVLTKADRIFGFAETVHRLESEQRQQMFGWSRPAEAFEAPFDIVEVRRAFEQMVARARTLRDSMIATVRLPEGLGEVDRMYAFPDELEGLGSALELYLKRVFSDSKLVDRLYFRGFYVTSGLQTGTPIAKVCAELLGSTGEADLRDLSALFTKQQAYFIKDLVRRRVFSERGLVRPTRARIAVARRNAWLGYGVAAAIALVSVLASAYYVFTEYSAGELGKFRVALREAAGAANAEAPDAAELLKALDAVWEAKQVAPRSIESAGVNRSESFEQLYASLCDERFTPALRVLAEKRLLELDEQGEIARADHATFLRRSQQMVLLLGGFDPAAGAALEALEELLPASLVAGAKRALAQRAELAGDHPVARSLPDPARVELGVSAERIEALWSRTLWPQAPQQVPGAAGYLVAWEGLVRSHRAISSGAPEAREADLPGLLVEAARYHHAHGALKSGAATAGLKRSGDQQFLLVKKEVLDGLAALGSERERLRVARGIAEPASWPELALLQQFAETTAFARTALLPEGRGLGEIAGVLDGPKVLVPSAELTGLLLDPLAQAGAPAALPEARVLDAGLAGMPPAAKRAVELARAASDGGLARKVVRWRLAALQAPYLASFGDAARLGRALAGGAERPQQTLAPLLAHAVVLERALRALAEGDAGAQAQFAPWMDLLETARASAMRAARPEIPRWSETPSSGLDEPLFAALGLDAGADAQDLALLHLGHVQRALAERWSAETDGSAPRTIALVEELDEHVRRASGYGPSGAVAEALAAWLANDARTALEQRLALHERDLVAASPALREMGSLQEAVAVVKRELRPQALRVWHDKLSAEWKVLDGAVIAPRLRRLEAREELAASAGALLRQSTRIQDFAGFAKERASWLDGNAIAFERATDGGSLAQALAALRSARLGRPADRSTIASVADWYVETLGARLDELAVQELRKRYQRDLELELTPHLELVFFARAADLPELAAKRDPIGTELAAFFGPEGEYAKLQRTYLQDRGLVFRPARAELRGEEFFAFDEFLRDLEVFLSGGEGPAKPLDQCAVELALLPLDAQEKDSVWFRSNYFFTGFRTSDPNFFFDLAQLDASSRFGPLDWSFRPSNAEQIWMRWSKSAAALPAGRTQPDDAELRVGSALAPLVLVWTLGKPLDEGRASKRWAVERLFEKPQKDTRGRFALDFARPVPVRPSYRVRS